MTAARAKPLLLYDGECTFCAYWVRYWQRLTGQRVDYRPYQGALDTVPDLSEAECRAAVQLIDSDGRRWSGAAASFRVLALGGHTWPLALIRLSPRLAGFAEHAYRVVSRRREAALAASRALWGTERYPASYAYASALFTRFVGVIYVVAFVSLALQVRGLIGVDGILPAAGFFEAAARALPERAWLQLPSVFWLDSRDAVLVGGCVAGALAGAVCAAGRWQPVMLALCYALYLSLFYAGQAFMSFQWDLLLLEAGFLAILLPLGPRVVPWLFRLLLFRFMFLSGCVKLLSGDPSWAALSALDFHYETQPLPTPLAWYVHQLPAWFDRLCVVGTFVVELALPWLVFAPRRPRMLAAGGFVLLECIVALTGNYNFFNVLTIGLCVFLIDDASFRRATPFPVRQSQSVAARVMLALVVLAILAQNAHYLVRPFRPRADAGTLAAVVEPLAPFRTVNGYGLFAVMTTTRPEIVVQGSTNGRDWQDYEFAWKPGDPERHPRWNVPHQPRLDWQMWFAALAGAQRSPWFGNFMVRLLHDAPEVTRLLGTNPFVDAPPKTVRAILYDYRFSTPAERRATGHVWQRRPLGLYYPAIRLR